MLSESALDPVEARRVGLLARGGLSADQRQRMTRTALGHIGALPEFAIRSNDADTTLARGGSLATYHPVHDELDVTSLVARWRASGWLVHLPRVTSAPGKPAAMEFAQWAPDEPLALNRFGIAEPTGESTVTDELEIIVVPCVAFDDRGTRVGFGSGFYDRALAGAHDALIVGVGFEVQRVALIRRRSWDVPLDVVVTDAGVQRF